MEILDVDDQALHLDDEQGPGCCVPPDDVDGPPIAVVIERVLDQCVPAPLSEDANACLDEPRVLCVEESRQIGTAPGRVEVNGDLDHAADPAYRGERHPVGVSALED